MELLWWQLLQEKKEIGNSTNVGLLQRLEKLMLLKKSFKSWDRVVTFDREVIYITDVLNHAWKAQERLDLNSNIVCLIVIQECRGLK
jgi:hypothetical protein